MFDLVEAKLMPQPFFVVSLSLRADIPRLENRVVQLQATVSAFQRQTRASSINALFALLSQTPEHQNSKRGRLDRAGAPRQLRARRRAQHDHKGQAGPIMGCADIAGPKQFINRFG